jgi:hypothetical protein
VATLTTRDLSVDSLAEKAYLNLDQRQDLEKSVENTQHMLHEARAGRVDGNIEQMEKQLHRESTMLHNGTPPQLDTLSKNRLLKKVKELEDEFTHSLPTYDQMQKPRPDHVDWHTAWERKHQRNVLAWKTGLLMLDPNNTEPNFRNIARLRGDTSMGVDPRKYWAGFDNIKFEEFEEATLKDLIENMDDAAYLTFLQLKMAQWAKPLILKKLDWSKEMYAAAEQRYQEAMEALQDETTPVAQTFQPGIPEIPEEEEDGEENPAEKWPTPLITALNMPISRFLREAKISAPLFYKARKTQEWPPAMKKAIETTLQRLQSAQQAVAEPESVSEPATTIDIEPS